ncbi:MAG: polyprenyl synthetase family protein [Anaerolineales bacterium]|nr:polyprenyl synthetase family protein [Anaerolineales bacterium]MCW5856317.1 polyprenyl synthetase family protein [Anaerolineales bacterium]
MTLNTYRNEMLPMVEEALKAATQPANTPGQEVLYGMLSYHMGWEGLGAGPKAAGKRVRSILLLLSCAAAGGNWRAALPAAAAVELLHNFSLIHDDIQDKSDLRRGRPTLWALHGTAQAINAGDAMFALAHISLESLEDSANQAIYAAAAKLLARTSLQLTQGQYLDMAYETVENPGVEAYWPMIWGKTAVLIRACTDLGARIAGLTGRELKAYMLFGEKLGLAYQVYDDLLGIWGDPDEMGKSAHTDLLSGKKSLPVLFGLENKGRFASRWQEGGIPEEQVAEFARLLEEEGAQQFTRQKAAQLTEEALEALRAAKPLETAGEALMALAQELGHRSL